MDDTQDHARAQDHAPTQDTNTPAKVGRPRNARVHELEEMQDLSGDQACMERTLAVIPPEDLPDAMRELPDIALQVIMQRARGTSYEAIGEKLGITRQYAWQVMKRYDPQGVFACNTDLRQRLAQIDWLSLQAKAQQVALDKAEGMSGAQAAVMAGIAADKLLGLRKLEQEERRMQTGGSASVLSGLKAIDAEITVHEDPK